MTDYLNLDMGFRVNEKRVRRLYRIMNLRTIYARPKTTTRDPEKYIYPYLLRNLQITRPNQVWQTDITYIPMFRGFMYMAAIIDVYSRKILGWSISNSMTTKWVNELLNDTVHKHGAPEIHNSDQGSQYTSEEYIQALKGHNIQISMDGKGRALDNVYIERFWRSIKQEKIYINPPNGGLDLHQMVKEYVYFYNHERRHQEIGKVPPNQLYYETKMVG
jgi:putative transposase